jgi:hypothetical protein
MGLKGLPPAHQLAPNLWHSLNLSFWVVLSYIQQTEDQLLSRLFQINEPSSDIKYSDIK